MAKKRTLNDFFAPSALCESETNKKRSVQDDQSFSTKTKIKAKTSIYDTVATAASISHTELSSLPAEDETAPPPSRHSSYPHAIAALSARMRERISFCPFSAPRAINNRPNLDLLFFEPYMPPDAAKQLFHFLRNELPFYRVHYKIKRGSVETNVTTPRYTSVFGVDDTAVFVRHPTGTGSSGSVDADANADANADDADNINIKELQLVDAASHRPIAKQAYRCTPRPIPECLQHLKELVEGSTGSRFNFVLVNYYADGADSISYHSDDERFLGPNPTIASLSLGTERDFFLKPKVPTTTVNSAASSSSASANTTASTDDAATKEEDSGIKWRPSSDKIQQKQDQVLKFKLSSGSMLLMRGPTQAHWLHSIPKRGGSALINSSSGIRETGRINITFRQAKVKGGTENYYRYNVLGDADGSVGRVTVFRWDNKAGKMVPWH